MVDESIRITIEIPQLDGRVFISEGYVGTFNEYMREWRIRYTRECIHFYILNGDEVSKIIKLGSEARRVLIDSISENFPKELIKVRETHIGPNEWEKTYYIYIPTPLLNTMKQKGLVFVVAKEIQDYETSTITLDVYTPESIERSWSKVENILLG